MTNDINVEVISIRKVEGKGNLKAYADVRLFGRIIIARFSIVDGKRGLFVAPPRMADSDFRWRDVVILQELDDFEAVSEAILEAYLKEPVTA